MKTSITIPSLAFITALTLSNCQPTIVLDQKDSSLPIDPIWGPVWFKIETKSSGSGINEKAEAKLANHNFKAVLNWRKYSPTKDINIKTWYGDQAFPPPKYVVDSLKIWIDERPVEINTNQYHYLCSQWKPEADLRLMEFHQRGSRVRLAISLGDGGESWSGIYEIDPKTAILLRHSMDDGVDVANSTQ